MNIVYIKLVTIRFDFGGGPASVHSVEVQTEFSHQQVKRRQRLKLATPRG